MLRSIFPDEHFSVKYLNTYALGITVWIVLATVSEN